MNEVIEGTTRESQATDIVAEHLSAETKILKE
jgi:hypothetical protein